MTIAFASTSRTAKSMARFALSGLCAAAILVTAAPSAAQALPLIRDTEIENLLADYARPIFRAAHLGTGRIKVRIVQNESFNAFVVDGHNVFVHTGTLMQAQTPNEVIGVIAHETGHITGGHIAALRARIRQDSPKCLISQIVGIGAMVLGGVAGGSSANELGNLGQGIMMGGCATVQRALLRERRWQESAADQAGLVFLKATKQSGRGMLVTFERLLRQQSSFDAPIYALTHPPSDVRIARLRKLAEASPYYDRKDSPQLQLRHDLMRAKLSGYLERPQVVYNRYPATDNSIPARYARAIAHFRQGGPGALKGALAEMDGLLRVRPDYPYFWEVKGDLLMRAGKTRQAIAPLRQALKLQPDASLIRVQLASALQSLDTRAATDESVALLRKSLVDDESSHAYRLLATGYYKQGKRPKADAMIAQAYFLEGNLKQAQIFAKRAQAKLRTGSPEWLKNDDIINFKPQT